MSAFRCVCGSFSFTQTEDGFRCTECGRTYTREGKPKAERAAPEAYMGMLEGAPEVAEAADSRFRKLLHEGLARLLSRHSGEGWVTTAELAEELASELPPLAALGEKTRKNITSRALSRFGLMKRRTRAGYEWYVG
jgi:hypothetical protein